MAETQNLHITFGQLPEGFRGPQGPQGPQGPVGPAGPQGPKGDSVDNTKYPTVAAYLKRQNIYATENLESILRAIIDNLGKPVPRIPSSFSCEQPKTGDQRVRVYGEDHFFVMLKDQANTKVEIIGGSASLVLPEPFGEKTLTLDYLDMTGSRVESYRITPNIVGSTVAKKGQYANIYGVDTLDLPEVTMVEEDAITSSGYITINLPNCTSWMKGPKGLSNLKSVNTPKRALTAEMEWFHIDFMFSNCEFIISEASDPDAIREGIPSRLPVYNSDKTKKFNFATKAWDNV